VSIKVKNIFFKNTKIGQAWWLTYVNLGTRKAENAEIEI
jgi:hypothetical protein